MFEWRPGETAPRGLNHPGLQPPPRIMSPGRVRDLTRLAAAAVGGLSVDAQRLGLQGVRRHVVAPLLLPRNGHLYVGPHGGHSTQGARLGGGGPVGLVQLKGG